MSWYDTSYRKLFFDFHSKESAEGLAADFDAEAWADAIEAAHAQAASVFCKGGFGHAFYRKGRVGFVHPHMPAGLDMVEEQVEAFHKRGIRAIGYYHTFGSQPLARLRPEWRKVDAAGAPMGHSMCMLSPLFEEHMLPQVQEIVENYALDAMFFDGTYAQPRPCYCESCKRRFREDTGLELPVARADTSYRAYVKWSIAQFQRIRAVICDVIHDPRPDVLVSVNNAYTPRSPEVVVEGIGSLMMDIFPADQAFTGSHLSKYWVTQGRPFDVMNSAFLKWWGDWAVKPPAMMKQEAATIVVNGGLTWTGYQMTERFGVPKAAMAAMGEAMAFVEERESLLVDSEPIPHVAVLQTEAQHTSMDAPQVWVDLGASRGVHQVLSENMIPYVFELPDGLLERLDSYAVVIVPDQRCLSSELVSRFDDWVKAGGLLIATALSGSTDEDGNRLEEWPLGELLGLRLQGRYPHSHAYVEVVEPALKDGALDMAHLAECPFALVEPTTDVERWAELVGIYLTSDGQPLLKRSSEGERTGHPAITVRSVGRGKAVYAAGELFRAVKVRGQWNLKVVIGNLLRACMGHPKVTVESDAWIEVVLRRQAGCELVHLVNHHGNRPVQDMFGSVEGSELQHVCVDHVLPLHNVVVHYERDAAPVQVTLEPQGVAPKWEYVDGRVTVSIPRLEIHTAIAIR